MASGSSGRQNSGSKSFDFVSSDDILCSYEDYGNQDSSSNGTHADPVLVNSSGKDFHKSRLARPIYAAPAYSQPEDSINQDMVAIVEKSMKKYVDNLMRFLEGISSRLSQLELYCYNLDKSIGEMRSELNRDHGDADTKLKSLEKHLQEVHRSVQILRDKQELADTQKELAKLQLAQKESSSSGASQSSEERRSTPAPETKKTDTASDSSNQQLALAIPHQVAPPQPLSVPPPSQPSLPQNVSQQQTYYLAPAQMPNPAVPSQVPQIQYVPSDPQGRPAQLQDMSRVQPPSSQPQVNQASGMQSFPQYQQQWSQQIPQQVPVQPPTQQPSSMPPQMRAQPTQVYSPYPPPGQPGNTPPPPQETLPSSMPMQMPYSGVPPPVSSRADSAPYGYGNPSRIIQQQPPSVKGAFGQQPGEGYGAGPQAPAPPGSGYMMYEADGGRAHHQPPQQGHFSQGMYPPPNVPHPNPQGNPPSNPMARNPSHPQFVRNHPYGELIEKLVSMGFRGDHVASVIQRTEESGQPVDFNSVLDSLNVGGSQRGWSG